MWAWTASTCSTGKIIAHAMGVLIGFDVLLCQEETLPREALCVYTSVLHCLPRLPILLVVLLIAITDQV